MTDIADQSKAYIVAPLNIERKIIHEIIWNANLMQKGNFINALLARHVSGTYANHEEL